MPRTPGAKNEPKDPYQELEKVKQLFADKGIDFPGEAPPVETGNTGDSGNDGLQIQTGDDPANDDDGYQCGGCGRDLDQQYDVCPYCGANLTWGND